eukprot:780679-Rhodomonas_salina.2
MRGEEEEEEEEERGREGERERGRATCRDLIADSLTGVVLRAHHLDDRTLHRRDSESRADGAEAARHRGVGERRRLFA